MKCLNNDSILNNKNENERPLCMSLILKQATIKRIDVYIGK